MIGDGPEREKLELLATDLGIAQAVRFAGSVAPADVPRWLRACDLACLVSLSEGFGLAAIEPLACGRPVVVTRQVPASAAVTDGVTGALCDSEDVAGMAAALVRARRCGPARLLVPPPSRTPSLGSGTRRRRARALPVTRPSVPDPPSLLGGALERARRRDPNLDQLAHALVVDAGGLELGQRLLVRLTCLAGLDRATLPEPAVACQDQRARACAGVIGHIR